jgi:uncharacterized phage protein gp47/JayE
MAGLTSLGFVKKRQPEIKAELEQRFRDAFGTTINLLPTEIFGQLIGIFSDREAEIWDLLEAVYNSAFPDTASGINLDNVAAITGAVRKSATKSVATVRLFGALGTSVPQGIVFSVAGVPTSRFTSTTGGTIGAGLNETQKIVFSAVPASGTFKLTFDGDTTAALQYNASANDIKSALELLDSVDVVDVTGSFSAGFLVEFKGTMAEADQPAILPFDVLLADGSSNPITITVSEIQKGYGPFLDVTAAANVTGPVQAPAGTLTVIETPIFGIDSALNLLDADLGQSQETDGDLKLRRLASLQRSGASTIPGILAGLLAIDGVDTVFVFENTTDIVDGEGRPPRSYEAYIQGGEVADIVPVLWGTKPAGIQMIGNQSETFTDEQGFSQTVKFSRPVEREVWLIVEVETNTDPLERGGVYPTNGDQLVRDAVLAYGVQHEIGEDVVLSRFYSSINAIPGVVGISIKAGFAENPAGTVNLDIDVAELAVFDSTRITVTSA